MIKITSNFMILIMFCIISNTYSQVGINTTDPKETLDVNGTFKSSAFSSTWKSNTNGGTFYTSDYIVIYNGSFYRNVTGTNTDIAPNTDTPNWVNISPQPEFLHAAMYQDENVVLGNNIDYLSVLSSSGNISLANNIGEVTLNVGRTYKLTAALNVVSGSGTYTSIVYQWYNITASNFIGNKAFIYPTNRDISGSDQSTAIAYITPTVTTTIDLRIVSLSGGTQITIDSEYGYITVEAL